MAITIAGSLIPTYSCEWNDKTSYQTKRDAEQALSKYRRQGGNSTRAYKCGCGSWHLSSSARKPKVR